MKKDLLSQLLYESQSYNRFEDIEKLVEGGMDLSMVPIQPLYVALQTSPSEALAHVLPKLSSEQRQSLRDIDMWNKDTLNPESAYHWLDVYSKCPDDDVVLEYVQSEDFLLTLKNQFTIQTFDAEDPEYPDNDNYFLTEDNQLLIEYPERFTQVRELKELIRRLYSELGVENAYAFLFKMVVDSYQTMEEAAFEEKRERLREYGFVDYYEALAFETPFLNETQLQDFISKKKGFTGDLDSSSLNQSLHSSSLMAYQNGMDEMKAALDRIKDEKRQHFLQFGFIRLVNARMTLEDALKNGSLAMTQVGNQTRQRLELGLDYVSSMLPAGREVFDTFDFQDIYKVGHSLIEQVKNSLKKSLSETPFEKEELSFFLGSYWNAFIDNSLADITKYKFDGSSQSLEIKGLNSLRMWEKAALTFVRALPYVKTFFNGLNKLKSENLLNDTFYLNYEVDNIDFEALMISSLINFVGGHFESEGQGKMGVTVAELKNFYHQFFSKNGEEYLIKGEEDPILREKIITFIEKFGLNLVPDFDRYLYQILIEQLNGYEIDSMDIDEFRHVGGPVLLNTLAN